MPDPGDPVIRYFVRRQQEARQARAVARAIREAFVGILPAPAPWTAQAGPTPGPAVGRLLAVYGGGVADERIAQAARIVDDPSLTVSERLEKIDDILPVPPSVPAAQLGQLLGVSKTAILKSTWWVRHRRRERQAEVERRKEIRRRGADEYGA